MIYTLNDELAAQILMNMLDNSPSDIDKREGAPTFTALAPVSDEISLLYAELKAQEDEDFIVNEKGEITMSGYKLDNFVAMWGETRKPGGKAAGEVILKAPEPTPVPAGTQVFAPATLNVLFATDIDVTATPQGVTVPVTAVYEGADGNVSVGAITGVVGDLAEVLTVTNLTETDGGFDEESDEELASRFLNNRRNPATSGNAAHYKQWATEVPGIENAKVYPAWNGPNTVKVILLSNEGRAPTQEKVQEVAEYIDKVKPIGAIVTVEACIEKPINVTATLVLTTDGDINAIKEAYTQMLTLIFKDTAFDTNIVRYSRLAALLLEQDGVLDWTSLLVNGSEANIELADNEVAVVGAVNFSVQP